MPLLQILRPALPILIGVSIMLTLSMGLRQSLGIFLQPLTQDIRISVSDFTLALAVQNLTWGLLQPLAGALAVRYGFRLIMVVGSLLYVAGLVLMACAYGVVSIAVGGGLLIGASLAFTATAMSMSVTARAVSETVRSTVLGMVSAVGSLGAMLAAPIGQMLNEGFGWRMGLVGFAVMALLMIPAAWYAGRVDQISLPKPAPDDIGNATAGTAARMAFSNISFVVMTGAYMVCGMQLVFLTTHLPSYLAICGLDPMLSAQTLGMIGGFNVLGSLFFGWAGQRWNKLALLGAIYILRSLALAWFFMLPATPASTLLFGAIMGFLWMGVSPLTAGAIAEMFGLRWQPMIQGLAFMSHQIGSFLGAYGGGLLYDALGSYTMAWRIGVTLGLAGGIIQVAFALIKPSQPPALKTAQRIKRRQTITEQRIIDMSSVASRSGSREQVQRADFGRVSVFFGEKNGKYPDANQVLVRGSDTRAALDAPIVSNYIGAEFDATELVIMGHIHEDHMAGLHRLPDVPVHVHEADLEAARSWEGLLAAFGTTDQTRVSEMLARFTRDFFYTPQPGARGYVDGASWDLGQVQIRAFHMPGHTAGHCVLLVEPEGVAFIGDIDLTGFGPYYGDASSSLSDFRRSLARLPDIPAKVWITAHHCGVYTDRARFMQDLAAYAAKLDEREQRLLEMLNESPKTLVQLVEQRLLYPPGFDGPWVIDAETRTISQHLAELVADGRVQLREGVYRSR